MKKSILREALKRCSQEIDTHPQRDYFAHWTFLVRDNRVISVGINRDKEPPKYFGYHKPELVEIGFKPKWHSELDAVSRCKQAIYGCEAINVRMNKHGQLRLSLPCKACRHLLAIVNCRKVWFTTDYDWGTYAY